MKALIKLEKRMNFSTKQKHKAAIFLSGIAFALCVLPSVGSAAIVHPTCKRTTATYNGNLGGFAGADAKCAAEYPDYRFARDVSFVYYAADERADGLMNSRQFGFDAVGANCYNWTSTSGYMTDRLQLVQDEYELQISSGGSPFNYGVARRSAGGKRVEGPNGILQKDQNETCSAPQQIWCCNF